MDNFAVVECGVRQLQARYTDAVWRKDYVAFGECFALEAQWRIAGRLLEGRKQCADFLEEVMPLFDRVLMNMQTPLLQIDGTAITGRTYVTELNARKDRRPAFSIGIYYDRYVLQDGRWRYRWHDYQLFYLGPPDVSAQFFPVIDYGPPFDMPGADGTGQAPPANIF
jgi:SnoaL-like domain